MNFKWQWIFSVGMKFLLGQRYLGRPTGIYLGRRCVSLVSWLQCLSQISYIPLVFFRLCWELLSSLCEMWSQHLRWGHLVSCPTVRRPSRFLLDCGLVWSIPRESIFDHILRCFHQCWWHSYIRVLQASTAGGAAAVFISQEMLYPPYLWKCNNIQVVVVS